MNVHDPNAPTTATPSLLDVFRVRCEARALLVREFEMELPDAVDGLQQAAEAYGLVSALGADGVQTQAELKVRRLLVWRI